MLMDAALKALKPKEPGHNCSALSIREAFQRLGGDGRAKVHARRDRRDLETAATA
jgi:hypothetical protein